ncbi:hypothetical protein [Antrihabitans cavernicola]|uniref:Transposase n=1 Tax=Antrihabitans cavernicola TaxID=2495913 RepID=A0A5A7SB86_9NOCA|nr:hypothetical protein [Spelaeibacter cavernicola]KAA0022559.1 hypothetical protein FOY51_12740 [Spelaeibacter cavernicola]
MADSAAERAAIRAATNRLIDGKPERSTGALTILQLAVEADVKRWVLTHKHTDLAAEFKRRVRAHDEIPSAFQPLDQRAKIAEAANERLRRENARLREQISLYAQVIHELTTERTRPNMPPNFHEVHQV